MAKNRRFEPIKRWILPTFEETGIDLRGENATSFNIVVFTRVKVGGRGGGGGEEEGGEGQGGKGIKIKIDGLQYRSQRNNLESYGPRNLPRPYLNS